MLTSVCLSPLKILSFIFFPSSVHEGQVRRPRRAFTESWSASAIGALPLPGGEVGVGGGGARERVWTSNIPSASAPQGNNDTGMQIVRVLTAWTCAAVNMVWCAGFVGRRSVVEELCLRSGYHSMI